MGDRPPRNLVESFFASVGTVLDVPVTWFREKIVEPNQQQYPWYHQKFRRVPSIDECYTDDYVCQYEANAQYRRDRQVETEIITILRERYEHCIMYEAPDHVEKCASLLAQFQEASTNWFTKYGDLGAYHDARKAYMKQKHRLLWERKYGPVGSGMNQEIPAN